MGNSSQIKLYKTPASSPNSMGQTLDSDNDDLPNSEAPNSFVPQDPLPSLSPSVAIPPHLDEQHIAPAAYDDANTEIDSDTLSATSPKKDNTIYAGYDPTTEMEPNISTNSEEDTIPSCELDNSLQNEESMSPTHKIHHPRARRPPRYLNDFITK